MVAPADQELIDAARQIIGLRYKLDQHVVGCALRTRSGRIHVGVHVECYVGRVTICAEAVAIGRAITEGDADIDTIVAVRQASAEDRQPDVVAPCGMCREMISDYAPECRVIVPGPGEPTLTSIKALLPEKYLRQQGQESG
jgi:cytidine deaminase